MASHVRVRYVRLFALLTLVVWVLFAGSKGVAWATPGQQPLGQTVPTAMPSGSEQGTPKVVEPGPLPPGATRTVVTPGKAATLASADGSMSLDIPAGAILVPGTVQMQPVTDVPAPNAGFKLLGKQVDIKFYDVNGNVVTSPSFAVPVQLCFAVSDADLASVDPSAMAVQFFDTAKQEWVSLPTTVDPASKKVCGSSSHFTLFGVAAGSPLSASAVQPAIPAALPNTGLAARWPAPASLPSTGNPGLDIAGYVVGALILCVLSGFGLRVYARRRK